jgi:membrane fusion protein (multidrug efflux system)
MRRFNPLWQRFSLRKWKNNVIVFIIILALLITGKYLFFKKVEPIPNSNKLVEVETITKQPFQQTIRLLGTIHPKHTAVMIAKGSGMLDALIPTGQKIKKGTLIAKIDNPDIKNNLQLSVSAEALAKAQFDRMSPLLKNGFVSPKEIEEKKQIWIDAQKELSKTKIELDNLRFYAPFDGIVGAYKKREGAQIIPGEVVVTIYDPSSLVVDVDIPCSNVHSIKEGQPVKVLGKTYTLTHFQKMLDEDTHMCPADIDIRCADCLMGATVKVDLVVAEKQEAIVIPDHALFLKNNKPHVYVVENNKIVLIAVKTGMKQQERIEIIEGLKPGQQLVIKGQERLYPNLPVDIYKPEHG